MSGLDHAIAGLEQVLDFPRRSHGWRTLVHQRIASIREALLREHTRSGDGWLAARARYLGEERRKLVARVSALGAQLTHVSDVEPVRAELHRLVGDLRRHNRRVTDFAYDMVGLELGGSE